MSGVTTEIAKAGKGNKARLLKGNDISQFQNEFSIQSPLLQEVIDEVVLRLPIEKAVEIEAEIGKDPAFSLVLKKATMNLIIILMFAKSMEKDSDFADTLGLLHEINFSMKDRLLGTFAKAMIKSDSDNAKSNSNPMSSCIDHVALAMRLNQLMEFVDAAN